MIEDRLNNIRSLFTQNEIDCVLVGSRANRMYLSGFTGSAGWLIITRDNAVLAVDFRYVEQAKYEAKHFSVDFVKGDFVEWLVPFLNKAQLTRIGIEADTVTLSFYQQLEKACCNNHERIKLLPKRNLVESLRVIKERAELESIMKACSIADGALKLAAADLKPGISEKHLAWQLEGRVRELGSEPLPFEIIVASGPNAALPHHRPSDRLIDAGEPIIIDMGARFNGYCSDITRT
jgi:Xaa-Pro aminopeptidase